MTDIFRRIFFFYRKTINNSTISLFLCQPSNSGPRSTAQEKLATDKFTAIPFPPNVKIIPMILGGCEVNLQTKVTEAHHMRSFAPKFVTKVFQARRGL